MGAFARRIGFGLLLVAVMSSIACVNGSPVGSKCTKPSDCSSDTCSGDAADAGICLCSASGQCGQDTDCCGGICCSGACATSPCQQAPY